jgi:TetR/AcrR family transcriptional regulator
MKERNFQPNTRQKVLNAAAEEFSRKGLAGARIDNIARLAGVNKAMIYYHFSSKEKLYRALITAKVEELGQALSAAARPSNDLENSLLAISRAYHDVLGEDHTTAMVLLHEMADGGKILGESLFEVLYQRELPARLRKKIESGMSEEQGRKMDSRHALASFVGMNLFYLLMAPIMNLMMEIRDAEDFRRKRPERIVDLFLHGLKTD